MPDIPGTGAPSPFHQGRDVPTAEAEAQTFVDEFQGVRGASLLLSLLSRVQVLEGISGSARRRALLSETGATEASAVAERMTEAMRTLHSNISAWTRTLRQIHDDAKAADDYASDSYEVRMENQVNGIEAYLRDNPPP